MQLLIYILWPSLLRGKMVILKPSLSIYLSLSLNHSMHCPSIRFVLPKKTWKYLGADWWCPLLACNQIPPKPKTELTSPVQHGLCVSVFTCVCFCIRPNSSAFVSVNRFSCNWRKPGRSKLRRFQRPAVQKIPTTYRTRDLFMWSKWWLNALQCPLILKFIISD